MVGLLALPASAFPALAAQTLGPVTDEVGVIRIPRGAPIQIGGTWALSGGDMPLGMDQRRSVEIALRDAGGAVFGHALRLNAEDDRCDAEGGRLAAVKLAANPQTVVVLGPACSAAATSGAPILWQAGITEIGTACTAPALTEPDRGPGYAGFARTVFSDSEQGKSDAAFVAQVMQARTIVTIHDGSSYAMQLQQVMADTFRKLGGTVLSQEAVAPSEMDMHTLLARIAAEKPDLIYLPVFTNTAAEIVRQARETRGLQETPLMGGSSLLSADFIAVAGRAVVGFRIGFPDRSAAAQGKGYPNFLQTYRKAFGEAPLSGFHASAYDAAMLAIKAIAQVGKTDGAGDLFIGKKALRDAVFSIKFDGISGPIGCDEFGECAQFKPSVLEFISADPMTFGVGSNPKQIWP